MRRGLAHHHWSRWNMMPQRFLFSPKLFRCLANKHSKTLDKTRFKDFTIHLLMDFVDWDQMRYYSVLSEQSEVLVLDGAVLGGTILSWKD